MNVMSRLQIRSYTQSDYEAIFKLYKDTEMPGSEFDLSRDSEERLANRIKGDPDSIILGEVDDQLVGSVSLIEDGRVAWLFRFRVREDIDNEEEVAQQLLVKSVEVLKSKGHKQILVYTTVDEAKFKERYINLGFSQGHDYTCFWKDI